MLSPTDPQHLISISDDKVWQWGANGCQIRPPFDGSHAAFSSDGAQFVSCFKKLSQFTTPALEQIVTEFQVVDDAHRCCFSPDNGLVAVAAGKTAYCWDITTSEPQLVETFIGHTGISPLLCFLPPLPSFQHLRTNQSSFGRLEPNQQIHPQLI
jgi:WD40 repeat protein